MISCRSVRSNMSNVGRWCGFFCCCSFALFPFPISLLREREREWRETKTTPTRQKTKNNAKTHDDTTNDDVPRTTRNDAVTNTGNEGNIRGQQQNLAEI